METNLHRSIFETEILTFLHPLPGELFIDATLGDGGHTTLLLAQGATVVGIDQDQQALTRASNRLQHDHPTKRLVIGTNRPQDVFPAVDGLLIQSNFSHLSQLAANYKISGVDGIIFDLGVSTHQLLTSDRGFGFKNPGPLDMRMDQNLSVTAADLVNGLSETELSELFTTLGDEPRASSYAKRIIRARQIAPITTTDQLANIIAKNSPRGRVHPATRVFQALRMAVNLEREALTQVLPQAVTLLNPGGRLCFISFHSGEDRLIKQFLAKSGLKVITSKPLVPTSSELLTNPRARSAKLRVAIKS